MAPENILLGWGSNLEGQLGMDKSKHGNLLVPTPIAFFKEKKKITEVACGGQHTLFVEGIAPYI
jgi:alpha-tubulin suppressor-like RCC1 family protein